MKLTLGTLAQKGIEDVIGEPLPRGVQVALTEYLDTLDVGPSIPFPRRIFSAAAPRRAGTEVELSLDPATDAAFERETERQLLTPEELATHAVFVYLTRLESVSL